MGSFCFFSPMAVPFSFLSEQGRLFFFLKTFFYLEFQKTMYDATDKGRTCVKVGKVFGLPESHYTDVWRETMRRRETENTTECT